MTDSERDHFAQIKDWKLLLGGKIEESLIIKQFTLAEQVPEWPYNFGWKLNLQKVINRSFLAEGNGLTWEVSGNTGHKKVDTRFKQTRVEHT